MSVSVNGGGAPPGSSDPIEGGVSQLTLDDGMFAPAFGEHHDPFYLEHPQLRQSGHVYDGNLGGGAFLVVAGEVASANHRVHYRVLEYFGTCFSIEFTVMNTLQNWTLFVPSSNEISYLLRIWHVQVRLSHSLLRASIRCCLYTP